MNDVDKNRIPTEQPASGGSDGGAESILLTPQLLAAFVRMQEAKAAAKRRLGPAPSELTTALRAVTPALSPAQQKQFVARVKALMSQTSVAPATTSDETPETADSQLAPRRAEAARTRFNSKITGGSHLLKAFTKISALSPPFEAETTLGLEDIFSGRQIFSTRAAWPWLSAGRRPRGQYARQSMR